jgi:hypothetical protein
MAVTTSGWTYALSTDPLINWPAQSLAVATKLEQRLPGGSGASILFFAIRTGKATVAANSSVSLTFPSGRFSVTPEMVAGFDSTSTTLSGPCSASTSSATAFNLYNSSNASRSIVFIAFQTTPTNALG